MYRYIAFMWLNITLLTFKTSICNLLRIIYELLEEYMLPTHKENNEYFFRGTRQKRGCILEKENKWSLCLSPKMQSLLRIGGPSSTSWGGLWDVPGSCQGTKSRVILAQALISGFGGLGNWDGAGKSGLCSCSLCKYIFLVLPYKFNIFLFVISVNLFTYL